MKAVMVLYDTLCRNFLSPYGNEWVHTPNFQRLAKKAVTFDTHYVCSLPCMPARRDLHNSRPNFLFRDWGPLEPYDDSMPEILKKNGIYTALITDHYHYAEDGGATYHNRYNTWILHRGQEWDACTFDHELVEKMTGLGRDACRKPDYFYKTARLQNKANRREQTNEAQMPQAATFADGLRFIAENHDNDNWFIQIETFDPHEPFFTQPDYQKFYPELASYAGKLTDWPDYRALREEETLPDIQHVRTLYAALVTMCDHYLGQVLDAFDKYHLWEDTLLIVGTDHGFLLGEHDWWGKNIMPAYEEISHTPLFVYDPVSSCKGERRSQLTSMLDIPVTILDFFGIERTQDMQGGSLLDVIRENKNLHDVVLFGLHAGAVAITDGRNVYFRAPLPGQEGNCYEYTLMPTRMGERFSVEDLQRAQFSEPISGSKGCRVLKTPARIGVMNAVNFGSNLYDVKQDPGQKEPLSDAVLEARMANKLSKELLKAGAPFEQFERLGLSMDADMEAGDILTSRQKEEKARTPDFPAGVSWTREAVNAWWALQKLLPKEALPRLKAAFYDMCQRSSWTHKVVSQEDILELIREVVPKEKQAEILYTMVTFSRAR